MPAIDFTVQAGNAFQVLEGFAKEVGLGSIALEHMAVNFTKVNAKTGEYETSISGVTSTHQKLTAVLKQSAAGIELVNLKLTETPKAAAASRKAMAASLKLADAKTVRGALESSFPTNGFSRTEIDSQRSKISQIASLVERGRASLLEYNNAAAASMGTIATNTLNETEQKILNVIKRIETAQERASSKARQLFEKQKTGTTNERFGAATALRLQREFGGQLEGLNPAAQERVKRQFDQIQALFSKGLDKSGYQRALKAMEGDTTITLTKIEAEVRHRLGRIHVELDRSSGNKGWLNKLFGGDAGGGLTDKAGGTSKVIGGLLLAQGIDQAASTIKTLANDTADFQKQIALLRTLTQDTKGSFDEWESSILRVSGAVGKSKEEIASSGYDLLSNQITKGVGDTETALTKIAKFANVTNSSVRDSVNLLSSAINSFGLDVSHTDEILGSLFTTIDLGRVSASDLANTLGRPAVAAKSLGLSMHELEAAQITISQTGLGVEQTNTLITNVFHKLLNPTEELKQHYKDLGVGTGEMYVKQLGLVGVLEDMIKITGGSTAELSKYFNEIRGEQGITQLTSRINVLKDALQKLKENSTYAGALAEFDKLPGQRFHEEIQKYTNAFLKFKDVALEALVKTTDKVGGLSNSLVLGTYLATGLGGVLVGLYGLHIFARMSGEASNFLELVGKLGPGLAAAGLIGTGLGIGAGALLAEYDDAKHAAEIFAEEGKQTAAQQAAAMATINAKMATANEAALKKMQGDALAYISKIKVGLQNLADAQKTAFKAVADELKDSFELVGQALKRVITQGEEKERHLVDSIKKRPEKLRDIHDKSRDDLYDARLATNRVRVGLGAQDQEGRIQKQRIGELLAESRKLSKSGNPKNAERAQELLEKAQAIAQERRTATTSVPVFNGAGEQAGTVDIMKYVDGNRIANFLIRERRRLLLEADKAQRAALETQRVQNEKDREASKKLQDRANDVTGFRLFNERGELNFRTPEKAVEERERRIKAYLKQAQDVARGQGVTPEAALATAKTLDDLRNNTDEQLGRYRRSSDDQLETHRNQTAAGKKGDQTGKFYENQIAKVRDLKKEMDESAAEQARFREASIASLRTLETHSTRTDLGVVGKYLSNAGQIDSRGSVKGLSLSEAVNRIPPEAQNLLARAKKSAEGDDPRTALNFVDQAIAKIKQLGGAEEEFLGKNGETTNVGKFLKDLRVELSLTLNAQERWKAAAVVSDNQTAQASRMIGLLNSFAEKYTSVSTAAEQFATVSESSFKAVNQEANQMVSNLATMLKQLDSMTNVANNIRNATSDIQQGISPRLSDPREATGKNPFVKTGPPPPGEWFHGGFVSHFADGGFMSDFMGGKYARGSDRHPAMLAGGESVNNQRATSRFAAQIIAMNAGFEPSFAGGKRGESGQQYTFGDIHVHAKSGDSAAKTTRELGAAMKREIRRGSLNL